MASNPRSARLVEKHRLAQLIVAINAYAAVLEAFRWLLRGKPEGEDIQRIVKEYPGVVQPYRKESYRLSALFYPAYREAELDNGVGDVDFGLDYSDEKLERINGLTIEASIPRLFDGTDPSPNIDEVQGFTLIDEQELDKLFSEFLTTEEREPDRFPDPGDGVDYFIPDLPDEISQEQVTAQILGVKIPDDLAKDDATAALDKLAGQGVRNSLNAGRETVEVASQSDKKVQGWMRVTDGNPCYFCALLASRGPVYKSKEKAELRRDKTGDIKKYHDNCGCEVVPVYSRSVGRSPEAETIYKFYLQATKGLSGDQAVKAFRKAWGALEAQPQTQPQEG